MNSFFREGCSATAIERSLAPFEAIPHLDKLSDLIIVFLLRPFAINLAPVSDKQGLCLKMRLCSMLVLLNTSAM